MEITLFSGFATAEVRRKGLDADHDLDLEQGSLYWGAPCTASS